MVNGINIIRVMKKSLLILAFVALFVACEREFFTVTIEDVTENTDVSNGTPVSFTVVSNPETKSVITISEGKANFTWETTDRAAVYTSDGEKVILTPSAIVADECTLTGTIPAGKTISAGAYVVYPAACLTGPEQITFPASYDHPEDAQGPVIVAKVASDISEGEQAATPLSFKYVTGAMRFTVSDVPSIATSFEVSSTKRISGVFTLGYDVNDDPEITYASGEGSSITINAVCKQGGESTFTGERTVVIPIPTVGTSNEDDTADQTITFEVKYSSNTLKTASVSRTKAKGNKVMTRKSFVAMPALSINPTVYIHSHFSGWGSTTDIEMSPIGTTYSKTIQTIGDQKFRVMVRYKVGESNVDIEMGHTSSDDDEMKGGTFENVNATDEASRKNAKISSTPGTYTLSYDNTSGVYGITKESDTFTPYLIGANYGNWDLGVVVGNASYAVTDKDVEGKYYKIGIIGKYKFVYNSSWYSSLGPNNDVQETAINSGSKSFKYNESSNNSFGSDNEISFIIFSVASKTYNYYAEGGAGGQGTTMRVNGSWSWDSEYKTGTTFNDSYGQLSTVSVAMTKDQEFCVEFYKSEWGDGALQRLDRSRCYYEGGNDDLGGANLSNADGANNFKVSKSGTYLFIMNDKDGYWNYKVIRIL